MGEYRTESDLRSADRVSVLVSFHKRQEPARSFCLTSPPPHPPKSCIIFHPPFAKCAADGWKFLTNERKIFLDETKREKKCIFWAFFLPPPRFGGNKGSHCPTRKKGEEGEREKIYKFFSGYLQVEKKIETGIKKNRWKIRTKD